MRVLDPGVADTYKLPCGCGELNLGPPEDQSVLSRAELSPQPKKAGEGEPGRSLHSSFWEHSLLPPFFFSSGCPGTDAVDQPGLELSSVLLFYGEGL